MKYKVITKEIYEKLDDMSYAIQKLKHVSHILANSIVDSDFRQFELQSLAAIIHERISTLSSEMIEFIETIEPKE